MCCRLQAEVLVELRAKVENGRWICTNCGGKQIFLSMMLRTIRNAAGRSARHPQPKGIVQNVARPPPCRLDALLVLALQLEDLSELLSLSSLRLHALFHDAGRFMQFVVLPCQFIDPGFCRLQPKDGLLDSFLIRLREADGVSAL